MRLAVGCRLMTPTGVTDTASVRGDDLELAIARALASVLNEAVSRSDSTTAVGVASQLAEQMARLGDRGAAMVMANGSQDVRAPGVSPAVDDRER